MIAVCSDVSGMLTKKICCPECHSRLCDLLIEQGYCEHSYRIVIDSGGESLIAIKCQKCGKVIGLGFKDYYNKKI